MLDKMQKTTSKICHIKSDAVVFLNTEIPRQIAAISENIFPSIKYVCICLFLFVGINYKNYEK